MNFKMKQKYLLPVLSLLLLSGCIDEINFDVSKSDTSFLVVTGVFTPGKQSHQLKIFRTNSIEIGDVIQVNHAAVNLLYGNSGKVPYQFIGAGVYELPVNALEAESGQNYQIEIDLDGTTYLSSPQVMPQRIIPERAYFAFEEEVTNAQNGVIRDETVLSIFVDTPLPQNENNHYLRWTVDEVYAFPEVICHPLDLLMECYITKPNNTNPQRLNLLSDESLALDRFDSVKVAIRRSLAMHPEEFQSRHYFSVYQYALSKEAFDYWKQVESVTTQVGSIFDTPPAAVRGNIYNVDNDKEVVLGFFEVAAVDTIRTFVLNSDFDTHVVIPDICSSFFRPDYCCNCRILENSSYERPKWF